MTEIETTVHDENSMGDAVGDPSAQDERAPDASFVIDPDDVTEDEELEHDLFVVYGYYTSVEDNDGSMVSIEKAYEAPRYVTQIAPGERGNLLLSAGETVTAEVAALVAG